MKYTITIILASLICVAAADQALAGSLKNRTVRSMSQYYPWHGGYYDTAWGMPVAVVVPPTAENQTKMGWGVGNTRVVPIDQPIRTQLSRPGHVQSRRFPPYTALAQRY